MAIRFLTSEIAPQTLLTKKVSQWCEKQNKVGKREILPRFVLFAAGSLAAISSIVFNIVAFVVKSPGTLFKYTFGFIPLKRKTAEGKRVRLGDKLPIGFGIEEMMKHPYKSTLLVVDIVVSPLLGVVHPRTYAKLVRALRLFDAAKRMPSPIQPLPIQPPIMAPIKPRPIEPEPDPEVPESPVEPEKPEPNEPTPQPPPPPPPPPIRNLREVLIPENVRQALRVPAVDALALGAQRLQHVQVEQGARNLEPRLDPIQAAMIARAQQQRQQQPAVADPAVLDDEWDENAPDLAGIVEEGGGGAAVVVPPVADNQAGAQNPIQNPPPVRNNPPQEPQTLGIFARGGDITPAEALRRLSRLHRGED